tara:strand:+ start:1452 stop:2330 length:879 start_codon:yes stop_codon:yes gene_type:complete
MISINKITPYIGAEIRGVDFSKAISPKCQKFIYEALIENLVIFFRNTKISPQKHLEFSEAFGDLDDPHPVYPYVDGFKKIVKLENNEDNPPDTDAWHTDLTFKKVQPFASVLVARSVPKIGGDTLWSSCYRAYDRLSTGMKKDFESIKTIHDMGDFRNTFAVPKDDQTGEERLNDGMVRFGHKIRNLIEVHPVSQRKFLNFNESFVSHIIGKTMNDSNSLKTFLTNHMNKPDDQVRWRWKNGDLAMWDNRITMHYAIADYMPAYRCMNRVTIINDKRVSDNENFRMGSPDFF